MKKDDYLTTMMQVPPKQKMAITPFDLKTQREAFSVSLEGLKGVRSPLISVYDLLLTGALVEYQCIGSRITTSARRSQETSLYFASYSHILTSDVYLYI